MNKAMVRLVAVGAFLVGAQVFPGEGSPEVLQVEQFHDMVSQTQEQFVLRKQSLQGELRKALVQALMSAYVAGVFAGDCSVAALYTAAKERNWGFLARVIAGAGLSVEELLVAMSALHNLYRVNRAEREFERMLRDFFASVEMQQDLREQLDAVVEDDSVAGVL